MQISQWPSIREESAIQIKPVIWLDHNLEYVLGLTNKHTSRSYNIVSLKYWEKAVSIQVVA